MMNIVLPFAVRERTGKCYRSGWVRTLALTFLIGTFPGRAVAQTQPLAGDVPGVEVQTRGPVHEAFAGLVTFNPVPGVVVPKAPPAIIEELPPEERPEGEQVTWIPGYWGWDDERADFLWISGTWRSLPPGRAWIAGYWAKSAAGFQWTSGYWADAAVSEVTYLPAPPASLEAGPNISAPSIDYGWTPGCWQWNQGRYFWRPGFWISGRSDWSWIPSYYQWSPRGSLFVGGFWDYPVNRRGVLFAPVYFESGRYFRPGFSYSPSIVIDLGVFSDHLFLRPRYNHFYFGDYYGARYGVGGFYSPFSFQTSRVGYNPIYSHEIWEHRQDREWGNRVQAGYDYRRNHEEARPPRTWSAQQRGNRGAAEPGRNGAVVAMPLERLAQRRDAPVRLQPVRPAERSLYVQQGRDLQRSQGERQSQEGRGTAPAPRGAVGGRNPGPSRVAMPRSPIVAKPGSVTAPERVRNEAPGRPVESRQSPGGALRMSPTPKRESGSPPMDLRQSATDRRPVPARPVVAPRPSAPPVEAPRRSDGAGRETAPGSMPGAGNRVLGRQAQRLSEQPVMKRSNPGPPSPATRPGRGQSDEESGERRAPGTRPRP